MSFPSNELCQHMFHLLVAIAGTAVEPSCAVSVVPLPHQSWERNLLPCETTVLCPCHALLTPADELCSPAREAKIPASPHQEGCFGEARRFRNPNERGCKIALSA